MLELLSARLNAILSMGLEIDRKHLVKAHDVSPTMLVWAINALPGDPRAAKLAFELVLRFKGRVLDAMAESYSALRSQRDTTVQKLMDKFSRK